MEKTKIIKISQVFLILFCCAQTSFSKTGANKLEGNTPKLEAPNLFKDSRPTNAVKLEVFDKVSRDSEHSYGHALEMERRDSLTSQKVYLEIKITNLLSNSVDSQI